MSKTPVRVGVVGVGHMGREHARIYAQLPQAAFVGVYDAEFATARKVAQQHQCRAFETLQELIENTEAVSIATPTSAHFDTASRFLLAGRHVLIEKPIANTTEEASQLVDMAREKGCVLQVGHIERFNPVLQALEERLTRPRFIESHRLSPYPGRSTDIGVVMDLMIHDLEIILHLVRSPVASVDAVGVPVLSKGEDIANARIRFENGCVANITTSRISPEKLRKIRVFQDDAYISLDYMKQEGLIYRKQGNQITREDIPVFKDEPLKRQLASFLECVQRGGEPVVSGDHATGALRVAAEICAQIAAFKP
jgi:predicted dehydrogenase